MTVSVGEKAPEFTLLDQEGREINLVDFKGKYVVLYFYPKDDTPGCTKEACGFNEKLPDLKNAVILGVSKDSVLSHNKFVGKYNLGFPLLSDPEGKVCEAYGTWGEKSMYGRTYFGIKRTTFLIDPDGKVKKIWPNVKVTGHVEDVMKYL